MRTNWRKLAVLLVAVTLFYAVAGVMLCEGGLRVRYGGPVPPTLQPNIADWRAVHIASSDGVVLCAWFLMPKARNGSSVVMLHGVGDTRKSGLPLARVFLEHGYSVLMPDSRGHGESGGNIVTYGLREVDDLRRWVDFLSATEHSTRIYGLGESLGAAVLLQALPIEHRFRAVVAECPYANFEDIARDRIAQRLPVPASVGRLVAWPAVSVGFRYARLKYDLDFSKVSPEDAVRHATTLIVLIHGLEDRDTSPAHSRAIAARNPRIVLWLVPRAWHTGAFGTAPREFTRRVLEWFSYER
jgi:dipeptidyl aminopeptidase/acylaminoacyl peptidase